jgi:hypothetical protein
MRLDNFFLKPIGVYGSKEEIVRFLCEIHAVDGDACVKLSPYLIELISLITAHGNCLRHKQRMSTRPRVLSLLSDQDYTLCAHSCLRSKNRPMYCTGLKIRHGMTRQSLRSNAIELRSCGTNDPWLSPLIPD